MSNQAVVSISSKFEQGKRIEEPILIGKDILELITGAMYVEPLCIYREYVQNACDSIDEAMQSGVYVKGVQPTIDISIDQGERSVKIRDTGTGVSRHEFVRRLTAIGGSKKRGTQLRGFRGVGRLSGLGYCQELLFRSRALGDSKVSELSWNGRRLKDLIRNTDQTISLEDAIREVAEFRTLSSADCPPHFFEVELRKVTRVKNDVLLNEKEIRAYLSQVAPVPIQPEFRFHGEIESLLGNYDLNKIYTISINDGEGKIYRPFQDRFPIRNQVLDRFTGIKPLVISNMDGNTGAVGWILDHSYLGAIPPRSMISGLRFRMGNFQVGSSDILAPYFSEPRFNGWCVGELHIIDRKVVPNGRRDDFEPSSYYQHLIGQVAPLLKDLSKTCRERSELRQKLKRANQYMQRARNALIVMKARKASPIVRKIAEWQCQDALKGLEHTGSARALKESERHSIAAELTKLHQELGRCIARFGRRDPFAAIGKRKRKNVEALVRLVFERINNQEKAEELARRVLHTFR